MKIGPVKTICGGEFPEAGIGAGVGRDVGGDGGCSCWASSGEWVSKRWRASCCKVGNLRVGDSLQRGCGQEKGGEVGEVLGNDRWDVGFFGMGLSGLTSLSFSNLMLETEKFLVLVGEVGGLDGFAAAGTEIPHGLLGDSPSRMSLSGRSKWFPLASAGASRISALLSSGVRLISSVHFSTLSRRFCSAAGISSSSSVRKSG